ncbi:MAG: phosphotransferase, partial [Deltaproteobacteria bacterium]|nr:phosphotransferase [Deltaproteobacteria bacterium]
MTLPALSAADAIPPAWLERFGGLERVGSHAGVQVLSLTEPAPSGLAFLKIHDDADRGEREAAILGHGLPVVAPRLLLDEPIGGGQVVLGLDDVRGGRDRALRRIPAPALPGAVALLGRLQDHRAGALPGAEGWARELRRRALRHDLVEPLKQALLDLLVIGDGFCHHDLHPSNWLCEAGEPVGLLDWASAGYADPESDLAGLVLAAGGEPQLVESVCTAWEAGCPGRVVDRARVWLLLYLQVVEAAHHKGAGLGADELQRLADQLVAGWPSLPALHGTRRVARVVAEPAGRTATDRLWEAVPRDQARPVIDALARAVRAHPVDEVDRFVGHACNDVLRLSLGGKQHVAKIYNKPVSPQLFALEAALSSQLANTGAVVLAPVRLDHGGSLFRVGCRPAALYPYGGDERCGNASIDRRRLAAAQAALHRLDPAAEPLSRLSSLRPQLAWADVATASRELLDPGLLSELRAVWRWADEGMAQVWELLPRSVVHGSLHRDHAGWWPGRGVVIYDLEKLRLAPRIADVVNTAYFMGYRGNDEQADPATVVHYLRAYHRREPLNRQEREAVPWFLLGCFLHDVKALAQTGEPRARLVAHGR